MKNCFSSQKLYLTLFFLSINQMITFTHRILFFGWLQTRKLFFAKEGTFSSVHKEMMNIFNIHKKRAGYTIIFFFFVVLSQILHNLIELLHILIDLVVVSMSLVVQQQGVVGKHLVVQLVHNLLHLIHKHWYYIPEKIGINDIFEKSTMQFRMKRYVINEITHWITNSIGSSLWAMSRWVSLGTRRWWRRGRWGFITISPIKATWIIITFLK